MKLLKCPPGLIGTKIKIGTTPVNIQIYNPNPTKERQGYTLVNDNACEELLKKDGYTVIEFYQYPGSISDLKYKLRGQFVEDHIDSKPKRITPKKQERPQILKVSNVTPKLPIRRRIKHKLNRFERFVNTDVSELLKKKVIKEI